MACITCIFQLKTKTGGMTRINRIPQLKDVGVFRNFKWPNDLPEFSQYNLIYGWNGTGKTTLSRVFRALEFRQPLPNGEAVVRIGERNIPSQDFSRLRLPVRVFNRDFIQENVPLSSTGGVPPIFVVGKENVEKQRELERLKAEHRTTEAELNKARDRENQADGNFDKYCSSRAKAIKDKLRAPGSGYNDYNRNDFRNEAEKMAAEGKVASYYLSDSDRDKFEAQYRAKERSKLQNMVCRLPNLQDLGDKVGQLLETTVVSAVIQSLKDDPTLAEWTRHGLNLHKKHGPDRCLFCEQPLPKSRLSELEAHFNAEYEQLLKNVEQQVQDLERLAEEMRSVVLPNRAELHDDLTSDFDDAEAAFRKELETAQKVIGELINALNQKGERAFEVLKLTIAVPTIRGEVVDRLNEVISRHNQVCDRFAHHVSNARRKVALAMIAENLEEFVQLRDAAREAKAAIKRIENDIQQLDSQIAQIERDIIEHRRPAEELSEDLRKYLGHDELQLSVKETGYTIKRNGEPANMLSEGEITALALLYFLKSLEDRSFDKAEGIVILDDPVSSLDATALYLAFSFIRDRTKDAGQLFILTHNFTFFRQVRNWFHHLPHQRKRDLNQRPARFYMLNCRQDSGQRCTTLRWLDPLLEKYESEYHYLFACVYRRAQDTKVTSLEENYKLPNMARRLLESFLAFRRPATSDGLSEKLKSVDFDEIKKIRIIRFLHTHSHSDAIDEPEHDLSRLGEAGDVLRDLLELMETEDKVHFEEMVKLVNQQEAKESEE